MDSQRSYDLLVKGIQSIDVTGDFNPCKLLLTGDRAQPVLKDSKGQVLIAAAQYGKGRMVVTGHEAMLKLPQFLLFVKNALDWLKPSPTAVVGVHRRLDDLSKLLQCSGIKVCPDATLGDSLGVFCRDAYDDVQADDLVKFVKRGGGLFIGGQAWHWSYRYGEEAVLDHFPGNLVTGVAGVYFTATVGEHGIFPISEIIWRDPVITQSTNSSINIQHAYNSLLRGIQSIDVTGDFNPCELLLTGDQAFPLLVGSNGQVLIAASQYGKGRMVVTAHEAMIQLPQFLPFIKNALDWLKSSPTALIGVHRSLDALSKLLLSSGIEVDPDATLGDSLGVFCRDAYDSAQADDLVRFVQRGGGLLIGGQAWYWSYKHGKEGVLAQFPGNLVTGKAGVYFTAKEGENGIFPVPEKIGNDTSITQPTNSSINIQHAYNSLLRGIQSIDVTGDFNPCELLLTGDQAFPVLVGSNGQILIAAAQYGKGRMVVTAHEAMIQLPQFLPFIKNALDWLKSSPTALIGVHRSLDALSKLLLGNGIKVQPDATLEDSLGVFCRDAYDSAQADDLVRFVQRGGGLLIGGQAWYWSYKHGKEGVLAQFPGNLVTGKAGVYFTAKEGENGIFPVPEKIGNDTSITQPTNSSINIQHDYNSLLQGIQSIDVTGDFIPCELLLTGDQAFPLLVGSNGQVLIAAAQYGKGRMVVTAHEAMIQLPQFLPFIKNALDWLKSSPTALIGVHRSLDALSKLLLSSGIEVDPDATLGDSLGVFCRDAYDSAQADDLVRFVQRGGGLLIGGQAWYWSYKHGKEGVLAQFPGNLVTGKAGVYFTAKEGENGIFSVPEKVWNDPSTTQPTNSPIHIQYDYSSLLQGIQSIDATGDFNPCELLLTGDQPFPLLVGSNGQVLIAASQYGKGRMVVTAHEDMIQLPQFLPLIKNALDWLKSSPTALIGVHRSLDALSKLLLSNGIKVHPDATLEDSLGVFCRDAYEDVQADDLVQFVKRGGGLLIGGQAWHWSSEHGKEAVLVRFPGNLVTSVAGVYFTGNVGENGVFSVPEKIPMIPLVTEHGLDIQRDLQILLNGVDRFNIKGDDPQSPLLPSPLLTHGALAFPVGISDTYHSFLAAAYYGRGRIVVASHEGLLNISSMKSFLLNAISWLSSRKGSKVGIGDSLQELYSMLNQAKIPCELTNFKEGLGIYCCTAYDAKEMENIHEFVSEGGGLLIGGQGWYWASVNPDSSTIAEYPGNKILNKFGIGTVGKYIEIPENSCPAGEANEIASTYHFRKAFLKFKEHIRNEQILQPPYSLWLQKLVQDIAIFLEIPAMNSRPFSSIHEEALELVQIKGIPEVSEHNPIQANSDQAVLLQIASVLYNILPEFQGLVPSLMPNDPNSYPTAPPQNIQVNGSNTGNEAWRSTGMYAPPASMVTLLFPASTLSAKLQVQIGCHTDDLVNLQEWKRPPVVTRRFKVQTEKMEISNLWGGLLYIIVPENSSLGYFSVTIEGATQAPYFKHGETSIQDWQDIIRHYPAPWAELETENIILTLPSDAIRNHDGIDFLLQTWDQMMRAITHLAAIPSMFPRPERIVADVQIAAGWMHSGYPVMSNVGAVPSIIDVQDFYAKGTWGPIHELGHNQQKSGWDFPPHTTEATCNLWSVYVNETVLSISREIAHSELQLHARKERIENYIRNGANLNDFEMFTALEPYLQLQEAFGWDSYIHILAKYQTMSNIPDDNRYKMNLWAETFSQEVNRNLAPFFKTWGWPIEDSVSENLALIYPAWAEDPMIHYRFF